MTLFRSLVLSAAAVTALALPVQAQDSDPLADAIGFRQAHMQLYAHHAGLIGGMARGNIEYDAEMAATAAADLALIAQVSEQAYWPEGSSNDEYPESKALPALWEDRETWQSAKDQLIEATMALSETAGTGPEGLAGIREVFAACTACHEAFWVEE